MFYKATSKYLDVFCLELHNLLTTELRLKIECVLLCSLFSSQGTKNMHLYYIWGKKALNKQEGKMWVILFRFE